LRMARAAVATLKLDFFEDRSGRRQCQSSAAIFLWNERRQIAGFCQGDYELLRVSHLPVEPAPVFAREFLAELGDFGSDDLVRVGCVVRHGEGRYRWMITSQNAEELFCREQQSANIIYAEIGLLSARSVPLQIPLSTIAPTSARST